MSTEPKNVIQGFKVYDELKLGDTVIDKDGAPIDNDHITLDHRILRLQPDGGLILQGRDLLDRTRIYQCFSPEEANAIRNFLNNLSSSERSEL